VLDFIESAVEKLHRTTTAAVGGDDGSNRYRISFAIIVFDQARNRERGGDLNLAIEIERHGVAAEVALHCHMMEVAVGHSRAAGKSLSGSRSIANLAFEFAIHNVEVVERSGAGGTSIRTLIVSDNGLLGSADDARLNPGIDRKRTSLRIKVRVVRHAHVST